MSFIIRNYICILLVLGGNLVSLFKEANRVSVKYDFEQKREYREKLFDNNAKLKKVAGELGRNGFSYNPQSDTIILIIQHSGYQVFEFVSFVGKKYYFAPETIAGFSSIAEIHLFMDENFKYHKQQPNQKCAFFVEGVERDPIPDLIKRGAKTELSQIYTNYSTYAADAGPEYHIRIIVKDGRVISATNWIFTLDPQYWEDLYIKSLPSNKDAT